MKLYKLVVRDKNGQVKQIHECFQDEMLVHVLNETSKGFSVTVTELKTEEGVRRLETCGTSGRR